MTLFSHHLKIVNNLETPKTILFITTFLNDKTLIQQELGLILQSIDEQILGVGGIGTALFRLFDLGFNLEELFKLELKGTKTEEILLELLREKYKKNIMPVAEAFLSSTVGNMIAPYLFVHCEQPLSLSYIKLLFEPEMTQKQLVLVLFAVAHNYNEKLIASILEMWEERGVNLNASRTSFVIRIFYLSLCNSDKVSIYSKLGCILNLNTINGTPLLDSIPLGQARSDKLSFENKNKLTKLLTENKVNESCLPIKVELLGLCGENMEMSKRIKYLQNLFTQPIDDILKAVSSDQVNKDKLLLAAVLMGLNNRMEVTFVEDPN